MSTHSGSSRPTATTVRSAAGTVMLLLVTTVAAVTSAVAAPAAAGAEPARVWAGLSTGGSYVCGVTPDGQGFCWGDDSYGQLGNGAGLGSQVSPAPVDTPAGAAWASISAGGLHSCGVTTEGDGFCWGHDGKGQLGNGAAATEVQVSPSPVDTPAGVKWASISAGHNSSCGVTTEGAAFCWGDDTAGRLGNGATLTEVQVSPSPVDTPVGVVWASISAGYLHTCGVSTEGAGFCWGSDAGGRVGNGPGLGSQAWPSPVPVDTPVGVVWASISAGYLHTCGVSTEGAGYCWGDDVDGRVGDGGGIGDQLQSPSPVDGPAGVKWSSIVAGDWHSCGVTTEGAAFCWGDDSRGQLGNGTGVVDAQRSPSPVDAPAGVVWASISASLWHSCGLTTEGAAFCWGIDDNGQLGNGPDVSGIQASPSPVVGAAQSIVFAELAGRALGDPPFELVASASSGLPVTFAAEGPCEVDGATVTLTGGGVCTITASQPGGGVWAAALPVVRSFSVGGEGQSIDFAALPHRTVGDQPFDLVATASSGLPVAFASEGPCEVDGTTVTVTGPGTCEVTATQPGDSTWAAAVPVVRRVVVHPAAPSDGWAGISAGRNHTCGVTVEGGGFCWGYDANGRLGIGAGAGDQVSPSPVDMPAGVRWASISAGVLHSCGVTTEGEGFCWGSDNDGRLGNGAAVTGDQVSPTLVDAPAGVRWVSISAGDRHSCGVTTEGAGFCWGHDFYGQLGNGAGVTGVQVSPTPVAGPPGVVWASISTGALHSCGVTTEGAGLCWGIGGDGQLGNGAVTGEQVSPSPVAGPPGVVWASISAGDLHSCGVTTEGEGLCWGADFHGQLGNGAAGRQVSPSPVDGPPGTVWASIAAGLQHSCGVSAEGEAFCWGSDDDGRLGNGDGVTGHQVSPSPVDAPAGVTWVSISASDRHSCAVTTEGAGFCWGSDGNGRLGNGAAVTGIQVAPSPVAGVAQSVDFAELTDRTFGDPPFELVASASSGLPVTFAAEGPCEVDGATVTLTGGGVCTITASQPGGGVWAAAPSVVRSFSVGGSGQTIDFAALPHRTVGDLPFELVATASSGLPVTFGVEGPCEVDGVTVTVTGPGTCEVTATQTGDDTWEAAPPVVRRVVVHPAAPSDGWAGISAGWDHTCGVSTEGAAFCWGDDGAGQLGNGVVAGDQVSPSPVAGPPGVTWASVSAGYRYSCGVTTEGAAFCWGDDGAGQLGNGAGVGGQVSPSPVDGPPGATWASISAGYLHSCGVTTEGAAFCWGNDDDGRLGNGAGVGGQVSPSPVDTPVGVVWASISAGDRHSCGVSTEGAAFCWGHDYYAQLGNGAGVAGAQESPTPVDGPPGVTWASVTAGYYHSCGVSTEGEAFCWGSDLNGVLGNGAGVAGAQESPTPVDGPSGVVWASVTAEYLHSCGVSAEGEGFCWGYDANGRLGNGAVAGDQVSPSPVDTPAGVRWAGISAGGSHSCGVTTEGGGFCWGYDGNGQLGRGTVVAEDQVSPALVAGAVQAIDFATLPDRVVGDAPFDLVAAASSGLTVTFASMGACTVEGVTVTLTGAGDCMITATQPGGGVWGPAMPVVRSFSVARAGQAISFEPLPDRVFGDVPFELVASASSGLVVSFRVDGACTVEGSMVTLTGAGECAVTASQAGDGDWGPAEDVVRSFSIEVAGQAISFEPLPDRVFGDAPFGLVASASSGLPVAFASMGACTVEGSVVTLTGAGECVVTASQAGDGDWGPAEDVVRSFSVARAAQSIAFDELVGRTFGDAPFGLVASASSGLVVSFRVDGACTVEGSTVTLTGAGECAVTASQAGDGDWGPAEDVVRSFTVAPAGSVTTVVGPDDRIVVGTPLTIEVSVTSTVGTPAGSVELTATPAGAGAPVTAVVDLDHGTATWTTDALPVGAHVVVATYTGDGDHVTSTSDGVAVTVVSTDEDFVRRTYRAVLGRSVDDGGLAHWVGRLEAGVSRVAVADALARSTEGRRRVVALTYQQVLGRTAEPAGRDYWAGRLAGDLTVEALTAHLVASAEAYHRAGSSVEGLVGLLYQVHLDRAPDAAGRDFWARRLTPDTVAARSQASLAMGRTAEAAVVAIRRAASPFCPSTAPAAELASRLTATGRDVLRLTAWMCANP